MTGTGTQTDPYIVSTFADFRTAVDQVGVYVELDPESSSKVLDVNDEGVNPFSNQIRVQCSSIKGNGWRIRNPYFNGSDRIMFQTGQTCAINDLRFENVVCNNGMSAFLGATKATFNACSFTGVKYTTSGGYAVAGGSSSSHGKFTKCTFAFKVIGASAGQLFSYCDLKECNINIDSTAKAASGTRCDLFGSCSLENVLVRGSIKLNGGGSVYLANNSTTMKNVFMAAELTRPDGDATAFYPGNAVATSCIVSDLIGSGITHNSGTNVQYVTAAQGKSADYLNSIGFPVSEVV